MQISQFFKVITFLLSVVFSINAVCTAAPGGVYGVSVSEKYGQVKERWRSDKNSKNQGAVIIIEDAHTSLDAQKNISKIVNELVSDNDISLLGIEGASGALNPDSIKNFPFKATKEKVLSSVMSKGEISGAEYQAFVNDNDIEMFGLETDDIYLAHRKVYLDTLEIREKLCAELASFKDKLISNISHICSEKVKEVFAQTNAYHLNEIDFNSYLSFLTKGLNAAGLDINDYLFLSILVRESENLAKINADELTEACDAISKTLDLSYEKENFDSLSCLVGAAVDNSSLDSFAQIINNWLGIHRRLNSICFDSLINECKSVEYAVMENTSLTEKDTAFIVLIKLTSELENLVSFEAVDSEVFQFHSQSEVFSSENINNLLDSVNVSVLKNKFSEIRNDLDAILPEVNKFYDLAELRNKVFVKNVTGKISEEDQNNAMIVTGGFHTQGLTDILKNKGVSYVVITPKINKITSGDFSYKKLMTGTESNYMSITAPSFVGTNTLQTIRSCFPIYEDKMRAENMKQAYQRMLGAEFFSEYARSKIISDGSVRFSNIHYKEQLKNAGWKEADLYDITAIYEVGEELGLVETRINDAGTIYKCFKTPAKNVALNRKSSLRLIAAVKAMIDRQLAENTFSKDDAGAIYREISLMQKTLEKMGELHNGHQRSIFIQTLLGKLPEIAPIEISFPEADKKEFLKYFLPLINPLTEEVRDLLEDFHLENTESFKISEVSDEELFLDIKGFCESKLFFWLGQKMKGDADLNDLKEVVKDALLLFLGDIYNEVDENDNLVRVVKIFDEFMDQYTFERKVDDKFLFLVEISDAEGLRYVVHPHSAKILEKAGIIHSVEYIAAENDFVKIKEAIGMESTGFRDKAGNVLLNSNDEQVKRHELEGHVNTAHLRKFNPELYRKVVDVILDESDLKVFTLQMQLFFDLCKSADVGYKFAFKRNDEKYAYDRFKLVDEMLAVWQEFRYDGIDKENMFVEVINNRFKAHKDATGEDLIELAGFDDSREEVLKKNAAGLDGMARCWTEDLQAFIDAKRKVVGEKLFDDAAFMKIYQRMLEEKYNKDHGTNYSYKQLNESVFIKRDYYLPVMDAALKEYIAEADKELSDTLLEEFRKEELGGIDYDEWWEELQEEGDLDDEVDIEFDDGEGDDDFSGHAMNGFQRMVTHNITRNAFMRKLIPDAKKRGLESFDSEEVLREVAQQIKFTSLFIDKEDVTVERIMNILREGKSKESLNELTRRMENIALYKGSDKDEDRDTNSKTGTQSLVKKTGLQKNDTTTVAIDKPLKLNNILRGISEKIRFSLDPFREYSKGVYLFVYGSAGIIFSIFASQYISIYNLAVFLTAGLFLYGSLINTRDNFKYIFNASDDGINNSGKNTDLILLSESEASDASLIPTRQELDWQKKFMRYLRKDRIEEVDYNERELAAVLIREIRGDTRGPIRNPLSAYRKKE